jgi:hypothetical protein
LTVYLLSSVAGLYLADRYANSLRTFIGRKTYRD